MKSWTQPTPEQISAAASKLARKELRRYFFDHLDNPLWLRPLAKRGFFKEPEPIENVEGGGFRFPTWPASRYLARMAGEDPEAVVEIILEAEPTDNIRVIEDYVEAARAMPADQSAPLVKVIKNSLANVWGMGLPSDIARLVAHLAKGGQSGPALELAYALFAVRQENRVVEADDGSDPITLSPRAVSNYSDWNYGEAVRLSWEAMAEHLGIAAFDVFARTLESGVRFNLSEGSEPPQDASFIWRPAVEEHEQNSHDGVLGALVAAVRQTSEHLITSDRSLLPRLVERLERRRWDIFRRIALYLLARFGSDAPELVESHLTDRALFDQAEVRHEYNALARSHFQTLPEAAKQVVLGWIDAGPDLERYRERTLLRMDNLPNDDDERAYVRAWQRDKLTPIAEALSDGWRDRYNELTNEMGVPDRVDFPSYMITSWARDEELPADLAERSVPELVKFFREWRPSDEFFSTGVDGVAKQLARLVSDNPTKYVEQAELLRPLGRKFVREFFNGVAEALKAGKTFDWAHVVDLMEWVMARTTMPVDEEDEEPGREPPGWGWTRDAIIDAISAGFEDVAGQLPPDMRQRIWNVLAPLTNDDNPTPEHEQKYGGSNMDPLTLSLNVTRGRAMHSVMRYILWVARTQYDNKAQMGFDEIPEVRSLLEQRLDVSVEPALSVRAVYGRWLPTLAFTDVAWVADHSSQIFPMDDGLAELREAAWNAFILSANAWDLVLGAIRPEYERAIERLSSAAETRNYLGDPDDRLAAHIVTWYWHGKDSMDDANGLLTRFYRHAPDNVRGAAMDFIGRSLKGLDGDVPPEIAERLVRLAEWRIAEAEAGEPAKFKIEMTNFGWCYVSRKLDRKWSIEHLRRATAISKKSELDHWVMEALAEDAEEFPDAVLACASDMIDGDEDGWHPQIWRNELSRIFAGVFRAGDAKTTASARELVDALAARGFLEFRSVLPEAIRPEREPRTES